ncbi:MAG: hypothetical protein R3D00_13120 [Bacteroidia bacterium]
MKYILFIFILTSVFSQTTAQKSILLGPEIQLRYNQFYLTQGFDWLNSGVFRPALGLRVVVPLSESWKLCTGLQVALAGQNVYNATNTFTLGRMPFLIQWQHPFQKEGKWSFLIRGGLTGEYLGKVTHRANGSPTVVTNYTSPFLLSSTAEVGFSRKLSSGDEWVLTAGADLGFWGSIPAYSSGSQGPAYQMAAFYLSTLWLLKPSNFLK